MRIGLQVLLEPALIELRIVEGGEARRQAAKCPDEPELSDDYVDDVLKLCLSCELESVLGLTLHVAKRISGSEKKRDQTVAGKNCVFDVAGFLSGGKGASQQSEAGAQMP
jgi:hypothetical protein